MNDNTDPSFSDVENEPSPYGLSNAPSSIQRYKKGRLVKNNNMLTWFINVGVILMICASVGFFITHRHGAPTLLSTLAAPAAITPATTPAAAQVNPTITIGIKKTKNGVQLAVGWNNLPNNTREINIFYTAIKNGIYRLIGSISIPPSSIAGGNGYLNIPSGDQNGYFYGVASDNGDTPLWTSSSTQGSGGTPNGNIPPQNNGGNNSSTAGTGNNGYQGSGNTSSTAGNGNGISGSSTGNSTSTTPAENFLVQHADNKIQISWQTLPAGTFKIVVSRSPSGGDPWTAVLTETNIVADGPYAIEIVDDTLGNAYYYKMDAYDANGNTITTFGPILLAPL